MEHPTGRHDSGGRFIYVCEGCFCVPVRRIFYVHGAVFGVEGIRWFVSHR